MGRPRKNFAVPKATPSVDVAVENPSSNENIFKEMLQEEYHYLKLRLTSIERNLAQLGVKL